MRVISSLVERVPSLQELAASPDVSLVANVFRDCLFGRPTDAAPNLPKCKSPAARNAAMRLLTVVAQGHAHNTSHLCVLLARHHQRRCSGHRKQDVERGLGTGMHSVASRSTSG